MGAFIVPRAQKKQFVPTITLDEISNLLVLYLSSIADYVHAATAIECDPEARRTTLVLQGQVGPKLDRGVCVRATIQGRTAPRLDTKIWADPFAVEVVSEDLGLKLDLLVEPHADQTIAISRLKEFREDSAAPAQVDGVTPVDNRAGVPATSDPGDTVGEPPEAATGVDASVASNDNTAVVLAGQPSENRLETAREPEVPDGPAAAAADAGMEAEADSSTDAVGDNTEVPINEDAAAAEGTRTEVLAGAGDALVEAAAELTYANVEAVADGQAQAMEPEALKVAEALANEGPIVGEAPVDVTFTGFELLEDGDNGIAEEKTTASPDVPLVADASEVAGEDQGERDVETDGDVVADVAAEFEIRNPEPADAEDVGKEDEERASALTVPEPAVDAEVVEIEAGDINAVEIDTRAEASANHAEPARAFEDDIVAATATAPTLSAASAESPTELTFKSPDVSGADSENGWPNASRADRPITIAEVLDDEEELVIELRGGDVADVIGEAAFEDIHAASASADDPATAANDGASETADEAVIGADDSKTGALQDIEEESADEASVELAEAEDQEKPVAGQPDAENDELAVKETAGSDLISDDVINAMTEQAVFGPGQRKRCAIIKGNDVFAFSIVGESHYQSEIDRIVLGRERRRGRLLIAALLVPEPNNFFDKYAVAVQINRRTVGYLTFEAGPLLLKALAAGNFDCAACAAAVSGGEDLDDGTFTEYSIKLDVALPFVLSEAGQPKSAVDEVEPESTARAA